MSSILFEISAAKLQKQSKFLQMILGNPCFFNTQVIVFLIQERDRYSLL